MRWLFLLLLLANVAYVGWELSREPAADSGATAPISKVPRIVLLRELEDGTAQPAMVQSGKGAEPVAQESTETPLTTAMAETGAAVDEPAAAADQVPAEPPAEPDNGQADQGGKTQPGQPPGEDRCYALGPFRELDKLSAFTQAIKSHVVETGFRSMDEKERSMFWVLLESTGSMAQARALSKELVSKKIRDYFIISSGAHKYGISLGHFREKEGAYRLAQRVRDLGFEPVVEPVFRTYTIYWLDYRMKAGETIPPEVFEEKLPASVSRLNRPCQP